MVSFRGDSVVLCCLLCDRSHTEILESSIAIQSLFLIASQSLHLLIAIVHICLVLDTIIQYFCCFQNFTRIFLFLFVLSLKLWVIFFLKK